MCCCKNRSLWRSNVHFDNPRICVSKRYTIYRCLFCSQECIHFSRGIGISSLCRFLISAGYHMRSKAERKSTNIVRAGLLHAATVSFRFSTILKILVCNLLPFMNPLCSSIVIFCIWHHVNILLRVWVCGCRIRSFNTYTHILDSPCGYSPICPMGIRQQLAKILLAKFRNPARIYIYPTISVFSLLLFYSL